MSEDGEISLVLHFSCCSTFRPVSFAELGSDGWLRSCLGCCFERTVAHMCEQWHKTFTCERNLLRTRQRHRLSYHASPEWSLRSYECWKKNSCPCSFEQNSFISVELCNLMQHVDVLQLSLVRGGCRMLFHMQRCRLLLNVFSVLLTQR